MKPKCCATGLIGEGVQFPKLYSYLTLTLSPSLVYSWCQTKSLWSDCYECSWSQVLWMVVSILIYSSSRCRSMGDAARNIFLVKFFGICKLRDPLSSAPKVQIFPWLSCNRVVNKCIRQSMILFVSSASVFYTKFQVEQMRLNPNLMDVYPPHSCARRHCWWWNTVICRSQRCRHASLWMPLSVIYILFAIPSVILYISSKSNDTGCCRSSLTPIPCRFPRGWTRWTIAGKPK